MKINNVLFESKLTENSFTQKRKDVVESYDWFDIVFNRRYLHQDQTHYENYQLIRNILAAYEHNCSFCLLCDARRPDLIREFHLTVRCIKDIDVRSKCNVVFWQEIVERVEPALRAFLCKKYGL